MSRLYEMTVEVSEHNAEREDDIVNAANKEWDFEDWSDDRLCGWGTSSLCGGETEYEFGQRLAKAIWKANGGPCVVNLSATYLEDLPTESYTFSQDNQDEWLTEEIAPDHD